MTETILRSITNSGTWMLILAPTYSTKIFIGQTAQQHTLFPLSSVCYLPEIRSSVSSPSSISLLASLFTRSVILHPATNSLVTLLARLGVMIITERAQRYLSETQSDKS